MILKHVTLEGTTPSWYFVIVSVSLRYSKNSSDLFLIFSLFCILLLLFSVLIMPRSTFILDPLVSAHSARGGKSERISSKSMRGSRCVEVGNDGRTLSPTLMKDISCEDDKGRIMEEVMKTYIKQQEKLNTILRRKQQLQMV